MEKLQLNTLGQVWHHLFDLMGIGIHEGGVEQLLSEACGGEIVLVGELEVLLEDLLLLLTIQMKFITIP